MATVYLEKAVSAKTAFSFVRCTLKGYLRNAQISSSRNLPSMTPKEASTTRLRKTSTKSAVNPQAVTTATSIGLFFSRGFSRCFLASAWAL